MMQMVSNYFTFSFGLSHALIVIDEGKHSHP